MAYIHLVKEKVIPITWQNRSIYIIYKTQSKAMWFGKVTKRICKEMAVKWKQKKSRHDLYIR